MVKTSVYYSMMNKYTTNTAEVRPLPFHTWHGEKWEVLDTMWHGQKFFAHLTDALMYAEGVNQLDDLSSAARQYWNQVAMA